MCHRRQLEGNDKNKFLRSLSHLMNSTWERTVLKPKSLLLRSTICCGEAACRAFCIHLLSSLLAANAAAALILSGYISSFCVEILIRNTVLQLMLMLFFANK